MSPPLLLGALSGAACTVAAILGINYRVSFTATAQPPTVALLVGLALGVLALAASVFWERRPRGLQVPPYYIDAVDDVVVWPLPPLWLPWTALGFATFSSGYLLFQEELRYVGGVWTLVGLLGWAGSSLLKRVRRNRPWKVPTDPAQFTWRTVTTARRLYAMQEKGEVSAACSVPRGRLPAQLVVVTHSGKEWARVMDSVADGVLACDMAGVHVTPAYAWRSGDVDPPAPAPAVAPPAPAPRSSVTAPACVSR